jgi:hypothetical protein
LTMQPMTHRFTIELQRLQRDSHDQCSACGCSFEPDNTAHAGYAANGQPLFVGDCCASQLVETAVRTLWSMRVFDVPKPESSLWRYMDFAKFVSLLKERSIHFARADCLGDSFEGAKGIVANKSVWEDHYVRFFRSAIQNPPPGYKCELSSEEVQGETLIAPPNLGLQFQLI